MYSSELTQDAKTKVPASARQRMAADLDLRCYQPGTKSEYLRCTKRFAAHFKRSPAEMGEAEIRGRRFLLPRAAKAREVLPEKLVEMLNEVFTEFDAIHLLTGAKAILAAGGGVAGWNSGGTVTSVGKGDEAAGGVTVARVSEEETPTSLAGPLVLIGLAALLVLSAVGMMYNPANMAEFTSNRSAL